jgi:hypothetical protein
VIIRTSLLGLSGRSFDTSDVTLGGSAIAVPVMRHGRPNATRSLVMVAFSFGRIPGCRLRLLPASG